MNSSDGVSQPHFLQRLSMPEFPQNVRVSLAVASLLMSLGFGWRYLHLLQPDPDSWFRSSSLLLAYTDIVSLYLQQNMSSHPLPFLQTWVEYPVLVGVLQYLASFAPGAHGYFVVNSVVLAFAALGIVWTMYRLDRSARLWVFAATPPLLMYASINWDLLPLFFALVSLLLFQHRRDGWSAVFVTLGLWAKLFPAVLLVWIVLQRAAERNWRSLAAIGGIVVTLSLVLNLTGHLHPAGWFYFVTFHGGRMPDGGSIWAHLPGLPVQTVNVLAMGITAVGIVAMGFVGTRLHWSSARFGLGAIAVLLLFNKLSSPQWDLWLMPFMALNPVPLWLIGLYLGVDLAYYWSGFHALYMGWGGYSIVADLHSVVAVPIAVARQVTLLVVCVWALGSRVKQ